MRPLVLWRAPSARAQKNPTVRSRKRTDGERFFRRLFTKFEVVYIKVINKTFVVEWNVDGKQDQKYPKKKPPQMLFKNVLKKVLKKLALQSATEWKWEWSSPPILISLKMFCTTNKTQQNTSGSSTIFVFWRFWS